MTEQEIMEKIYSLLMTSLDINSPILSGNLKSNIELVDVTENSLIIAIKPGYYDVAKWEKEGILHFIGEKNGKISYADDVNNYGGFFTNNESKHFANRSCFEVCNIIASECGAELINKLEL